MEAAEGDHLATMGDVEVVERCLLKLRCCRSRGGMADWYAELGTELTLLLLCRDVGAGGGLRRARRCGSVESCRELV